MHENAKFGFKWVTVLVDYGVVHSFYDLRSFLLSIKQLSNSTSPIQAFRDDSTFLPSLSSSNI